MIQNDLSSNDQKEPIAIVGIGLRFPGDCSSPQDFWEKLLKSFDGISEIPPERWANSFYETRVNTSRKGGLITLDTWKEFDPLFFGISPRDAELIDPQERLMLMVTYEALEDAQIPSTSLRGTNTGVFVGVSSVDYGKAMLQKASFLDFTPSVVNDTFYPCLIANRVSYGFDFRGPSMSVDTACSSSLVSLDLALNYIENGTCDVAIAAGINSLLDPNTSVGHAAYGVTSDYCLSFDANAKGYVRSEGCGVVVLKKLSAAERDGNRIYALIKGRSSNSDGHFNKDTITTPSPYSQTTNIIKALDNAKVKASDIYYVEAHATGTVVGDPIEVFSLSQVFTESRNPETPLKIGSVKTNVGHLECAAGIISLIKVSLMLKNKTLAPTKIKTYLNPKIPFQDYKIRVVTEIEDIPKDNEKPIYMGVNSFGIGGANSHVILQQYKETPSNLILRDENKQLLVPISSNSILSLDKYIDKISNDKETHSRISFKEFALLQSIGKAHLSNRRVVIASNWEEFNSKKDIVSGESTLQLHKETNENKIIFVFCGQGPQWNEMGLELYKSEPVFKSIIDYYDSLLKNYTGYSIFEKMCSLDKQSPLIHHPIIAQPSLFLFQVGIVELYKQWGIKPEIVLGHSFGDVTAAFISGAISLETAIHIVHIRSLYQNETIGTGRMLVVGITANDFYTKFSHQHPDLEIACFNSPFSQVITGSDSSLNKFVDHLKSENIFNTFLRTPCSFHSKAQESIRTKVLESLSNIKSQPPTTKWYSTVTGELHTTGVTNQYIFDNLRKPVDFQKTIESIHNDLGDQYEDYIYVEIAPHPTLIYLIQQSVPSSVVISPLQRNRDGSMEFYKGLSKLHCIGANVNFQSQFELDEIKQTEWKDKTAHLPRYQWDSDHYWYESSISKFLRLKGPSTSVLGHQTYNNGHLSYHSDIDVNRPTYAYLKDHKAKDQPLLPGSAYLDAIFEAFKSYDQDVIVKNLNFDQAFFLRSDQPQRLQTYIEQQSPSEFKVKFYFKNSESYDTEEKWLNSATGNIILSSTPLLEKISNFDNFKNLCNLTTISSEEFYQITTQRLGIKYGPAFQHIKKINVGKSSVFATLNLSTTLNRPQHVFNPSLMDSCFQAIFVLFEDRSQVLFKSIEEIRINKNLIQEIESNSSLFSELYLKSTLISAIDSIIKGKCTLLTKDGKVVFKSTFSIIRTDRKKLKPIKFSNEILYDTCVQSKNSPLPGPSTIKPSISYLDDYMSTNSIMEQTPNIVRWLCFSLMKLLPGFNLDQVLNEQIDEVISQSKILQSQSNIRFYSRIIEILKEHKSYLTKDTLTEEYIRTNLLLEENEKDIIGKAITVTPQVLMGDESKIPSFFKDVMSSTFVQSLYVYYAKQMTNLIEDSIRNLLDRKEKRIFKILEMGGGTGCFTHCLISKLDELLKGQDQLQVYFTYTDISMEFYDSMKEFYKNYDFKSNLKVMVKYLDLEKDLLEQGFLTGSYDMVVMSSVIHIVSDINPAISNIQKVLAPNGWLLMAEPSVKVPLADIIFGNFSKLWTFTDNRSDHFSVSPSEWRNILTESNGFHNTNVFGYVDKNRDYQDPKDQCLFFIHSQKLAFETLPNTVNENQKITIIVNENQIVSDINSFNVIKLSEIQSKQSVLKESSDIIFIPGVEPLNIKNYQSITYDLCSILKMFIGLPKNNQPNISVITRQKNTSNFFANSLCGIFRSAMGDHKELKMTFLDISSDFQNDHIDILLKLTSNFSTLGDYEYSLNNNQLMVERQISIGSELLQSSKSMETDTNNLGCKVNLKLQYKLTAINQDLQPNQIEILIKSAGLNHRDSLLSSKLYSKSNLSKSDSNHPPYGIEGSGIITRVGSQVVDFKIGDCVVGIIESSLASHGITTQDRIVHKPNDISFIEASSIPFDYLVAYYCISKQGNFSPEDESILVHGATSGVGISALEILRWMNCKKVYATASTPEKRDYIKSKYSDIIVDVFDSNSKIIYNSMKMLNSGGIDLIINTLSSDYLTFNFNILSPFGRIIDLTINHSKESLDFKNFKNSNQYSSFDAISLIQNKPLQCKSLLKEIFMAISQKKLGIPNINVFNCSQVLDALFAFKERKHIGKIVVDCSNLETDILLPLIKNSVKNIKPVPKLNYKLDEINNTVVIVGQQGISFEIISWLSRTSTASDIVVLSYSPLKSRLEKLINQSSSKIHFFQVDISNFEQLESTFKTITLQYPPVESIFNLAVTIEDISLQNITIENIKKVHQPKAIGTFNLHSISTSLNLPVKRFVMFSSVSSHIGSTLQPAYNSTNLVVESICRYRSKVCGLPSISVINGTILDEGMAADRIGTQQYLISKGYGMKTISQLLGGLDPILNQNKIITPIIENSNFSKLYQITPHHCPKIEHFVTEIIKKEKRSKYRDISAILNSGLSQLLSLPVNKIQNTTTLKDYGVDSLKTVEIKLFIDENFERDLFNISQIPSLTVKSIVQTIEKKNESKNK